MLGVYTNAEEGYEVIVDKHKEQLRLRIKKGKGLLNKMIIAFYPLSPTRLFNPTQGILFDFTKKENGSFTTCEMRVNGAKLTLTN